MILVKDFSGSNLEFGSPVYIGKCFNNHSLQATFRTTGSATITAVNYALLGSNDGVGWVNLGSKSFNSGELTAKTGILFITDRPISHIAVSITAFTKSGTGDAFLTLTYEGY